MLGRPLSSKYKIVKVGTLLNGSPQKVLLKGTVNALLGTERHCRVLKSLNTLKGGWKWGCQWYCKRVLRKSIVQYKTTRVLLLEGIAGCQRILLGAKDIAECTDGCWDGGANGCGTDC